ncbi:MAG TPA: hypothetical protein VF584_09120 [Longimicrobium sp.]|jgi:hypothetical protein
MSRPSRTRSTARRISALVGLLALAGCGDLLGDYRAPLPARVGLADEEVIVRVVYNTPEGSVYSFYVDRVGLLASRPHSIDRVVAVRPAELAATVEALRPRVGDRLRVSTRYLYTQEEGQLASVVPDWPFDRYFEYQIGLHALEKVERIAP